MKTTKTKKLFLTLLGAAALYSSVYSTAFAQDSLLEDTDSVLNSEQIDIDGAFAKPSEADRIAALRKKLEKQSEDMVQKKIEDIRIKEEKKLARKLKKAFANGNINSIDSDSVSTAQAAPQKVIVQAPKEEEVKKNLIAPRLGVTTFQGDGNVDFESTLDMGIQAESMVTDRIAVGVGINYTLMEIQDLCGSQGNFGYGGFGYNYGFNNTNFCNNYYGAFGQEGRTMEYEKLNIEVNGKFFITKSNKIRPYAGLGLGYNRTSLDYEEGQQQNNFNFNGFQFGDEGFDSNYISGSALVGAEVNFTNTIGMNLEFKYTKALTSGFSENSDQDAFGSPDQSRLEDVGQAIQDSHQASIVAGLLVRF